MTGRALKAAGTTSSMQRSPCPQIFVQLRETKEPREPSPAATLTAVKTNQQLCRFLTQAKGATKDVLAKRFPTGVVVVVEGMVLASPNCPWTLKTNNLWP